MTVIHHEEEGEVLALSYHEAEVISVEACVEELELVEAGDEEECAAEVVKEEVQMHADVVELLVERELEDQNKNRKTMMGKLSRILKKNWLILRVRKVVGRHRIIRILVQILWQDRARL
jgi:hypothetical protein